MTVRKFNKQPVEQDDVEFDFSAYLERRNDLIQSVDVVSEEGLSVLSFVHSDGVVQARVAGGTDGEQYKVSATITTTGGRVKQGDLIIRVREL